MMLGRMEHLLDAAQPEEQHGFRAHRRIEEHLLNANLLIDKTLASGIPIWIISLDLSKAFDRVEWRSLWKALRSHGVSDHLIFFPRTFLQQHVLDPVPVLAADYGLSGAGWEAAVDGCLQPACVSQELVQSGRVTSSTELCGCRKLEQRSCEGSLRGNGEDATPTVHPSGLSSAAHGDRCAGSAGLREKSEEGRGFLTPAPSSFNAETDKAAAASTKQLRLGVPALALRRAGQSTARLRIGSRLRLALARERGDQCRIDGELSSVPEGQAIAHDLDPSGVADRHINVHVSDANIARNTRSGLATDTGKGMLERQRPSRKDTRGGTGSSVVTQRVEAAAAAASAGAKRQGKAQLVEAARPGTVRWRW